MGGVKMSAIAARALNSTIGTSDLKGLDELIEKALLKCVPKTIETYRVGLPRGSAGQPATVRLKSSVNLKRCKAEVTSYHCVQRHTTATSSNVVGSVSMEFQDKNTLLVYGDFEEPVSATIVVTSYEEV